MIESAFQTAVDGLGQDYLNAERQLLEAGQAAVPFLQEKAQQAEPLPALIAQALLGRIEGHAAFQECLDFLDQVERRTAIKAGGAPPIEWVANTLLQRFGQEVAPLLRVHLAKLGHLWPGWKTRSVLLYFAKLGVEASADTLVQFLATTPQPDHRDFAKKLAVAVGGETVLAKLDAELEKPELPAPSRLALQETAERIRQQGSRPEV